MGIGMDRRVSASGNSSQAGAHLRDFLPLRDFARHGGGLAAGFVLVAGGAGDSSLKPSDFVPISFQSGVC